MKLEDISQNLQSLQSFRASIKPFLRTLEKYHWDSERERDPGFKVIAFLDFSDLFRYLHPLLDITAYRAPDRFYAEQVALQYLLSRDSLPLYLLPQYLEEYRLSMRSSQIQLSEFAILPELDIKRRVVRMNRKVSDLLDELLRETTKNISGALSRLNQMDQELLDVLFDGARTQILENGAKRYEELLKRGRIRLASSELDVSPDDLKADSTEECDRLRHRLESFRPGHRCAGVRGRSKTESTILQRQTSLSIHQFVAACSPSL